MNTKKVIQRARQFAEKVRELETTAAVLRSMCREAESAARYYAEADLRYELGRHRLARSVFTPEEAREAATTDLMRVIGEAAQEIRQAQELAAWLPREHSDLARAVIDAVEAANV